MDDQHPPTPLQPTPPSPSPASAGAVSPADTLPGRINAATRKQHTELNRLIIHRLALALPPNTNTPLLYGKGLVPFSRLFLFFEVEWDLLTRLLLGEQAGTFTGHDLEIRQWLSELRPEGLPRTERTRADVKYLRFAGGPDIFNTASEGEDEWTTKMRVRIRAQPHVLVAFAWVMYMAIFSGGRWIRQQLANAGPEFWTQESGANARALGSDSAAQVLPGFTFMSFKGEADGEDIKTAFKSRLAQAEALLTPEEKQDVVEASKEIFDRCIELVYQLDRVVARERTLSWLWAWAPGLVSMGVLLVYYLCRQPGYSA